MLKLLRIKNIAVIKELALDFSPGLTLMTGETGAGKSIILDSLNLILGRRASSEIIRTGEEEAEVEVVFSADEHPGMTEAAAEMGIEPEHGEFIFKRKISLEGTNRTYINNSASTLSSMNRLGAMLVDIHGQHQHQSLLDPATHIDFLDIYGGNAGDREELSGVYCKILSARDRLDSLRMDDREKARRLDMLRFQIGEIEKAGIKPGEEESLKSERNILANAEQYNRLVRECLDLLYESEQSVLTQIKGLTDRITALEDIDGSFDSPLGDIKDASYKLEDLVYKLRACEEDADFSPRRLEEIESTLAEMERLKRKYGPEGEDVFRHLEQCRREMNAIDRSGEEIERLERELESLYSRYTELSTALSGKRKKDAAALEKKVRKELGGLAFKRADFEVRFSRRVREDGPVTVNGEGVDFGETGIDDVEFLIAPNVGEDLKPMAKIASGGELSRIMLALKTAILGKERGKTLVFDEIDSGIGGREAEIVGEKLKSLAGKHQVMCVTHLPQIACFADQHYKITKEEREGRTFTGVIPLDRKERVEELARMLGGKDITEMTQKHAEEFLEKFS